MDMHHMSSYRPPLSLTVLGSVFIGLFGCISLFIAQDIIRRKGWKTMMGVMIPVYILNALYLGPLTIWTYWKYGRPAKPTETHNHNHQAGHIDHSAMDHGMNHGMDHSEMDHSKMEHGMNHDSMDHSKMTHSEGHLSHAQMHGGGNLPIFVVVTIAVCHCGAGCLLGDIVGEWIVFGTGAKIRGREIWVEFLLDYAFALIFGIGFQYWSIAPMSGDYGWNSVVRAAKADFLSLTFFEIGLFGWMAIFQLAIFQSKLEMDNVVYWWMMQIGMFFGHWTAFPINWWLIKADIKEAQV